MSNRQTGAERDLQEFDIEVQRQGWGNLTLRIQAASLEQAQELALDQAGNHLFSEKDSCYEVVGTNAVRPRQVQAPRGYDSAATQACAPGPTMDVILQLVTDDDYYHEVAGVMWTLDGPALARMEADSRLCVAQHFSEVRRQFYANHLYRQACSSRPLLNLPEMCIDKSSLWICAQAESRVVTTAIELSQLRAALDAGVKTYVHAVESDPLDFLDSVGLQSRIEGAQAGSDAIVVGPFGELSQDEFPSSAVRERSQN